MNAQFQAAARYAKQIPKMKERNKSEGVRRLMAKIKGAIGRA